MKMDLDDCVYYSGTQGNRLWGRYAKRVYQVEKEIFSGGCIENIDFAQRVLEQLGSDGRRYLLECDYLDFYEKSSVAKAFCIDLPFSLEKPNGNTVYIPHLERCFLELEVFFCLKMAACINLMGKVN